MAPQEFVEQPPAPRSDDGTATGTGTMTVVNHKTKQKNKRKEAEQLPYLVNTKQELDPYRPHQKIYLEMKYARKFVSLLSITYMPRTNQQPTLQPQQTKSFIDLPAEIRIKIYRYAFQLGQPLELWAESDTANHTYWLRVQNKKNLLYQIRKRQLNLSFLRTCRMVHIEGSELFYGENEFRFTSVNGHMVANLFVRKIYKQHFQWIKELTMAMPFYIGEYVHPWSSSKRKYNDINPLLPSSDWADKEYDYLAALQHLVWNFKRMERLNRLCLVLPFEYEFERCDTNKKIWDEMKGLIQVKPDLEVEIMRMAPKDRICLDVDMTETESWKASYYQDESHA
jgi:hypothetical protein